MFRKYLFTYSNVTRVCYFFTLLSCLDFFPFISFFMSMKFLSNKTIFITYKEDYFVSNFDIFFRKSYFYHFGHSCFVCHINTNIFDTSPCSRSIQRNTYRSLIIKIYLIKFVLYPFVLLLFSIST